MKNWRAIFLSILIINQCIIPLFATSSNDIEAIESELKNNNKIIQQKKKKEKSILSQLSSLRKNIYQTQRKLNNAYQKYNDYQTQIKDTELKLSNEKQKLEDTQSYLNEKITTLYKNQNRPVIELIFNSNSFSSMLSNLYFYERVIKNDFNQLTTAKTQIKKYNEYKQNLESNKSKAKKLKQTILTQRNSLKSKKNNYQKSLSSLRNELKDYEARNKILLDESQQLSNMIQNKSDTSKSTYFGTGTYARPCSGYISSRYGWRRHPIFKRNRMHNGMDFAAPRGYRIRATDSGYILFSGSKKGYGNVTIINHGYKNGKKISSLYAHQWRMLVKKGQFVEKGSIIGYVGSTGYSTGPHLHFEIRENGKPVNPSQYLRL